MRNRKPGSGSSCAGEPVEVRTEDSNTGRWTPEEHLAFEEGLRKHGKAWKRIAEDIPTRTVVQIRTHAQKYFLKLAKFEPNTSTSIALRPPVAGEEEPVSVPKQRRSTRKRRSTFDDDEWEDDTRSSHASEDSTQEGDAMQVEVDASKLSTRPPGAPHGAGRRAGSSPRDLDSLGTSPSSSASLQIKAQSPSAAFSMGAPPSLMIKIPSCASDGELAPLMPPAHPLDGTSLPKMETTTLAAANIPQQSPTSVADLCSTLQTFFPEAGYGAQGRAASHPGFGAAVDPATTIMPLPPLRGPSDWCDPLAVLEETAAVSVVQGGASSSPFVHQQHHQQQQPTCFYQSQSPAASFSSAAASSVSMPVLVPGFPVASLGGVSPAESELTASTSCTSYLSVSSSSDGDVQVFGSMVAAGSHGHVASHYSWQQQEPSSGLDGRPSPSKRAKVEEEELMGGSSGTSITSGEEEDDEAYGFFCETDDGDNAAVMDDDRVMDEVMRLLWDADADEGGDMEMVGGHEVAPAAAPGAPGFVV